MAASASRQWSCEARLGEYSGLQATAMGMERRRGGAMVMLAAAKKGLALVNLDAGTMDICDRLPARSGRPSSVTKVSFGPSPSPATAAVAFGDGAIDLVSVSPSGMAVRDGVRLDSRPVSDVDWSPRRLHSMASCSTAGNAIRLWDVREFQKPTLTLESLTSCSQLRWSPSDPNLLSSAHDGGDLRLWDIRQPSLPVRFLLAHGGAGALSLDWGARGEDGESGAGWLVTSGLDCLLKLFDPSSEMKEPLGTLKTYVPFGHGFATVILPQLRRNDNSLFLWNACRLDFPVHCFYGHRDVILDFDWRRCGDGGYQMVSWSRDQTLRVWQVDPSIQAKCREPASEEASHSNSSAEEEAKEDEEEERVQEDEEEAAAGAHAEEEEDASQSGGDTLTNAGGLTLMRDRRRRRAQSETLPEEGEGQQRQEQQQQQQVENATDTAEVPEQFASSLQSLQREFDQMATKLRGSFIRAERMEWARRKCKFSVCFPSPRAPGGQHRFTFSANFPSEYPVGGDGAVPTFALSKGSTLDTSQRKRVMRALKHEAREKVAEGRTCLEPCLEKLETTVAQIRLEEEATTASAGQGGEGAAFPLAGADPRNVLEGGSALFGDVNVPFPRTSGARFCGNGHLVVFGGAGMKRKTQGLSTPRALAVFNAQRNSSPSAQLLQPPSAATLTTVSSSPSIFLSPSSSSDFTTSLKRKGRFNIKRVSNSGEMESSLSPSSTLGRSAKWRGGGNSKLQRRVTVFDVSRLMPYSRKLAQLYSLRCGDASEVCLENARIASSQGLAATAHLWKVCSQIGRVAEERSFRREHPHFRRRGGSDDSWENHPHGKRLLSTVLSHLVRSGDVQTAAVLACVFAPPLPTPRCPSPVAMPLPRPPPSPPPPPPPALGLSPSYKVPIYRKKRYRRRAPPALQKKTSLSPDSTTNTGAESGGAAAPLTPPSTEKKKFWFLGSGAAVPLEEASHNPYHTFHSGALAPTRKVRVQQRELNEVAVMGSDSNLEQFVTPYYKASRSNSWTAEAVEESSPAAALSPAISEEACEETFANGAAMTESQCSSRIQPIFTLLNEEEAGMRESVRSAYSAILSNWGLFHERAKLDKFAASDDIMQRSKDFRQSVAGACSGCGRDGNRGVRCSGCGAATLRCAVCRLPVRGMARSCPACGHGGHSAHWRGWFVGSPGKGVLCPAAGCSCRCAEVEFA